MFDKSLSDLMSSVVMDYQLETNIDNNTLMLMSLQLALAWLLQAILTATEDLAYPDRINVTALTQGLSEMLEWILDNTIYPEGIGQKNG